MQLPTLIENRIISLKDHFFKVEKISPKLANFKNILFYCFFLLVYCSNYVICSEPSYFVHMFCFRRGPKSGESVSCLIKEFYKFMYSFIYKFFFIFHLKVQTITII